MSTLRPAPLAAAGVCIAGPAVILLDLNLPRVSRLEVLQSVRRTPLVHSIPIIMLT